MRFILILLACMLTGCITGTEHGHSPASEIVSARLVVSANGAWRLDYHFPTGAREWVFERSQPDFDGRSWRVASFHSETAGAHIVSREGVDRIVLDDPGITNVRLRIEPFTDPLRGDNTPVIRFSDGSVAIYPGHFAVARAADDEQGPRTVLTLEAPGSSLLVDGRILREHVSSSTGGQASYIYVGSRRPAETADVAYVVDPGLPVWIREEVETYVPRLLSFYTRRLGRSAVGRPTVFVAWGGARAGSSFSGSVLDSMVMLELGGTRLAQPDEAMRQRVRRFLGHETAHFWVGHTLRQRSRADAWIYEGAADLMAIRAQAELVPSRDSDAELRREIAECAGALPAMTSLQSVSSRGGDRAAYACGAVMHLAVEQASGVDIFAWLRPLLNRSRCGRVMGSQEWLQATSSLPWPAGIHDMMRALVDQGTPDPAATVQALTRSSRVPRSTISTIH